MAGGGRAHDTGCTFTQLAGLLGVGRARMQLGRLPRREPAALTAGLHKYM